MIRFVFRFVGLLCFALAFIFLVYDGTKWIADRQFYVTSVSTVWSNVHQNSLIALQPQVEGYLGARFWQSIVQPYLLEQPAWLVLGIVGALLILLGRKKRKLIGYARD